MDEIVNKSLQKIAKGAGLIFVGTIAGMLLGVVNRIIIIRYVDQDEYGLYSLSLVIFNIVVTASMLGLGSGIARQIAFYRGKNEISKVRGVVVASFEIGIVSSIIFFLILFFASNFISEEIFKTPDLSASLKIFAIGIPFGVSIRILVSVFRGFNKVSPSIYFDNLLKNVLLVVAVGIVAFLGCSYTIVVWAFTIPMACTAIAFLIYLIKHSPLPLPNEGKASAGNVKKDLLFFSLPLLFLVMSNQVIGWLDTLLIGRFMMPEDVGLYNSAVPLVHLLPLVAASIEFLYVPLTSELYAQNKLYEIKKTYSALTKWIFAVTMPLFLIFVLFPEATLNALFGAKYIEASSALHVLSSGFFLSAILGPNGLTLLTLGKTRILMWSVIIALIVNIVLNIVLIPSIGILGAAIATASSLALKNIIISARLYLHYKIHPFTINYMKPMLASTLLALIIYFTVKGIISPVPFWLLPILLIIFLGTYALAIVLTRSFDDEDIMILLSIEKRMGVDLKTVKRVLRKFI